MTWFITITTKQQQTYEPESDQGRRTMNKSIFKNVNLKTKETCMLFDSMVPSVLYYASEI